MNDKLEKWCCIECNALLGWVKDKEILRVRRQSICIAILRAEKIEMPCYRCGKLNELKDEEKINLNKDKKGG